MSPNNPPKEPSGRLDAAKRRDGVTIRVDRERCIGAASCVALAAEVFRLDSQGKAVIVDPDGATFERLLAAAKSCPVNAIEIEDADGRHVWP